VIKGVRTVNKTLFVASIAACFDTKVSTSG